MSKKRSGNKTVKIKGIVFVDVDVKSETERLSKIGLTKAQLKRQRKILQALTLKGDFSKCHELYEALPHDSANECSEKDYVGAWFEVIKDEVDRFHVRLSPDFGGVRIRKCVSKIPDFGGVRILKCVAKITVS